MNIYRIQTFIAFLLAEIFLGSLALAAENPETIATCGGSNGHSYFHSSNLVGDEESGWSTDQLTEGSITVQKIGDNFDVIHRSVVGLQSSVDSGAIIVPIAYTQDSLGLVVIYPDSGTTEVYNFQHLETEFAEVSWTSTKVNSLINKSAVFYAKCSK